MRLPNWGYITFHYNYIYFDKKIIYHTCVEKMKE